MNADRSTDRPTDPREQLEVRITALLLGEASPFEEAELLEAIKHDPALAAYYEEMRQMVRRVEETIQLTPVEAAVSQPKLADARRDQLEKLFKQPAPAKTIKLESPAGRARRLGWLQHAAAIAAAMVILLAVVGTLLPTFTKAKSKASLISRLMPQIPIIDQLGDSQYSVVAANGVMSTNFAIDRRSAEFVQQSYVESRSQLGDAAATSEQVVLDERFLARYGNSQGANQRKRPAKMHAAQSAEQIPAPGKPAEIYLPSAAVDTAGVPVQLSTAGAERGVAADNTARYYFRESGVATEKDSLSVEGAAADSPTLAFAVPDVSAPLPRPAPVPLELQKGRPELLTDSLARKADAASVSEIVLGRKLATLAPAPTAKSEAEELRPVTITGSRSSSSDAERRFRRLYDVEAKDSGFDGAALPAGGVRGRAGGATRGTQVDGLAALGSVANSELDRVELVASSPGMGGSQGGDGFGGGVASRGWNEGRSDMVASGLGGGGTVVAGEPVAPAGPANAPTTAGQSLGNFDVPTTGAPMAPMGNQAHAANTWSADFGAIAAQPAVESFGRGGAVDDFVSNGQVATDLFAKQQADTKSFERLERLGEETSLGLAVEEAKITAEPMYAEQLLTEQRHLDRERVEGLSKQAADSPQIELSARFIEVDGEDKRLKELTDQVSTRGESAGLAEIELKRKAAESGWIGVLEQPDAKVEAVAEAVKRDADRLLVRQKLADAKSASRQGDLVEATRLYRDAIRVGERVEGVVGVELQEARQGLAKTKVNETTQSRFDTLADLSSSEFAFATDNGREQQLTQQVESVPVAAPEVAQLAEEVVEAQPATPPPPSLEPLPEIRTVDNAFSTFSLNVSDVSFQLAASSLENGQMPDGARLRSEEFINAFDYRDPLPAPGQRVAFNWERARNPFAHNRELLRLSVQTAAAGREPGQPLNLVLLLDNSGSMERADRVQITEQMLRVLAAGLNDYDRISVISFARTPRLIVDGLPGGNHQALLEQITGLNPDGGTNLEDALKLGYETAAKHFQANGNNRVILITDGAANLGNVDPAQLRERVIDQRKRGIALDCFGVGWEGYNDNLLESLSRNGDGRYGFLNDAGNAVFEFSRQLAGALQVAAADVKAQVEFNPNRVTVYRQIGYQQHQLTKEQFRDNTVDAAEIGAAEAGNALYSVEVNPNGSGPIGTFRARYRVPATGQYEEKEWVLDYTPVAPELEKSGPAMRLASSSAAFAEWLANSPYAQSVTPDALQNLLRDVPETFAPDPRPAKLQAMIQQARAISGR